nr:RNA polymerase sigma factor [uncultured Dyadobacter sp.]
MSESFWEATYTQNIAKIIGVCCRYTQNRQAAEDLAHDAFLVAIDKVSSFENKGPFEAWLRRIAVNTALQYLREQKRHEQWAEEHAFRTIGYEIQDENPTRDDHSFSEAELMEVIGHLPEHHRIVFNLHVVDNFTHAQIAALLGISEGTSKSHLSRARKKVRQLLYAKRSEHKKRKRAFIWWILSYPTGGTDRLLARELTNLSIQPQRKLSFPAGIPNAQVPDFKPAVLSYGTYMKTGIMALSAALFLAGGSELYAPHDGPDFTPVEYTMPAATQHPFPDPNTRSEVTEHLLFSGPKPATISENPVIVKKTKHSEPMKNVSILGGIMVASLALDTAGFPTELPNALKNRQAMISRIPEPTGTGPATRPNSDLPSGSFYASELFWSEENGELYFLGDRVSINVSRNKFSGRGRFSFLHKVNYLVVDGVAVKRNETVKLQEKKYKLISLNESEGARKYGENGKAGVVEITLAE